MGKALKSVIASVAKVKNTAEGVDLSPVNSCLLLGEKQLLLRQVHLFKCLLNVILTSLVGLCHRNCLSNQDEHQQKDEQTFERTSTGTLLVLRGSTSVCEQLGK